MLELTGLTQRSDYGGRVVEPGLFRLLLDLEVQKAQRLRYCIALVRIHTEDSSSQGSPPFSLTDVVGGRIRTTDAIMACPPSSVALLLVDADTSDLPAIVTRLAAPLQDDVAWSAGGASYPLTASDADDMLRQAEDMMVRAREAGGRRLYVPS